MSNREEYFARVRPLIGDGLRGKVVSVDRPELTGRVVELLASLMLERVRVRGEGRGREELRRRLAWKNGFAPVRIEGDHGDDHDHDHDHDHGDEDGDGHGHGGAQVHVHVHVHGDDHGHDHVHGDGDAVAPHVTWDRRRRVVTMNVVPGDRWSRLVVEGAVARGVRDVLTGKGWPASVEYWGNGLWPWALTREPVSPPELCPRPAGEAHVMVIGCGSVGSEAVRLMAGPGLRWTLVDGGAVSVFNPYRQWFGTSEIGQPKVSALARRLRPAQARAVPLSPGRRDLSRLLALLDEDRPDLVMLATGTGDHGWMAEALWRAGVPHLAACAYPQARYFEVSLVLPGEGTPCLHCFRGHLYRGAEASAPMSDELASFLYQELDDDQRRRAYVELVAEPASALETGAIAAVAARCAAELLCPPRRRGAWRRRALTAGTTCLLGGNVIEQVDGQPAYGLTYPGQVVRLGLEDVAGAGHDRTCEVCGRRLEVKHRVALPTASAADVDRGLLEPLDAG